MESLQGPPPVSSCVLTIMATLSLWELYLCPSADVWLRRRKRSLDGRWFIRRWFSKRIFPDVSVPIWMQPGNGCGPRVSKEEGFGGGERMLWFVSQSRSDSDASEWDDGWGTGARVEEKESGRGGGKMCSDESEEWHEKEAEWEKGKGGGGECRGLNA